MYIPSIPDKLKFFFCFPFVILSLLVCMPCHAADSRTRERLRKEFEEMGAIREWTPRAWEQAFTYNTLQYTIKTNTSHQTARYIGKLMEMTAKRYREVFGIPFQKIPKMTVYAYADREEYEEVARRAGLQPLVTSGFYSPEGPGAIYIPYVDIHGMHPSLTLFHEGTHQFVFQAINFRIPFSLKPYIPEERHILMSVPYWLNEGLATYMETAQFDGETIEIGRVNAGRLVYLQRLLKNKTAPSVREVLERRYGQPFSAEHYSVAWGIVYALRHHYEIDKRDASRRKLVKYIESCKQGFLKLPVTYFRRDFMQGNALIDDFDVKWRVHIGNASRSEFERIVLDSGMTLEEWEKQWVRRIMNMDHRKPYGGTNRGDVVEDKGREGLY